MTKKVNIVKKHAVEINMADVNATLKANVHMFEEHVSDGLDPRDEDQNPVSFADNPYYNRDLFLAEEAGSAARRRGTPERRPRGDNSH